MPISKADALSLSGWLREATEVLSRAGVASPRHDAERLAAFALGLAWSDLWARSSDPLTADAVHALEGSLRRRADGEPLAYIVGSVVFYGMEFACGPGVLVPRPETETLVDVGLELIRGVRAPIVVDLGCGAAAIAAAIASHRPDAHVVATDVSAEALAYARRNADALGVRLKLARGDLFDAVAPSLRGRVDLVVSNPPYVHDSASLPPDVLAEPAVALFGGPRGDEILRRIVGEAPRWLSDGGALALEIGDASQISVVPGAEVRPDPTGRPRVVWARY